MIMMTHFSPVQRAIPSIQFFCHHSLSSKEAQATAMLRAENHIITLHPWMQFTHDEVSQIECYQGWREGVVFWGIL